MVMATLFFNVYKAESAFRIYFFLPMSETENFVPSKTINNNSEHAVHVIGVDLITWCGKLFQMFTIILCLLPETIV